MINHLSPSKMALMKWGKLGSGSPLHSLSLSLSLSDCLSIYSIYGNTTLHSEPGRLKLDYDKKSSPLTIRSTDDIFKFVQKVIARKLCYLEIWN